MEREKYISLFVDESKENLLALNEYLLELEKGSGDLRLLNDIFRVAHTLKGMSATMGFKEITFLTHEMENLLDFLRNAQLAITSEIIDILFLCLDSLEVLADNVVAQEPKVVDITNLMYRLKKLIKMGSGESNAEETRNINEDRDIYSPEYNPDEKSMILQSIENGYYASEIEVLLMKDSQMKAIRVLLILQAVENKAKILKTTPARELLNQEQFGRNFIISIVHSVSIDEIKESILSIAEVMKVYVEDLKQTFKEEINPNIKELSPVSKDKNNFLFNPKYNETEKSVLLEAINQNFKCFEVYISLFENTVMKFVRVNMVLNLLNELDCQLIRSNPPSSELMTGNVEDNFVLTIISDKDENFIKKAILSISEISQVEVLEIVKSYLNSNSEETQISLKSKQELPEFTNYERLMIIESNNSGKRVILLGIHLMQGTIMKFARYVLVTKKLENFGEIIKTIPSQEDIETELFDDFFQIVFVTNSEDKQIIHSLSTIAEVTNIVDLLPVVLNEKDAQVKIPVKKELIETKVTLPQDQTENRFALLENITIQDKIVSENVTTLSENNSPALENYLKIENQINENNLLSDMKTNIAVDDKKNKKVVAKKPTIRVDIERLDELINLVEELVIVRSRLTQIGVNLNSSELIQSVRNLSMISGNLQNNAMRLRMVPVEHIFNRFPRMIRDIAKSLNKEINFVIEGEETELDRTIIDEIGDPLVHLLRNSADHGIESSEQRVKNGKNKIGNINLIARHEGNNVLIIVEDDGGGVNIERVKQKAVEKNIISSEQSEIISDEDALQIIFLPGFSTIEKATDLSGRGVGMDAVMSKVKSIGGNISINSEKGVGTRFTIKLPLTLAIMEVLLVNVGNEIFAIPITYIEEVRELLPEDIKNVSHTKVVVVRDRTIPLINLSDKLQVRSVFKKEDIDPEIYVEVIPVIIVRTEEGKKTSGLVVDKIIGQEDVVIKSLGRIARDELNYISGTANLGDGNLALILNITNLT